MLQFQDDWRYNSPGRISNDVDNEFSQFIKKLAKGEQNVLEHFKKYFGAASGHTTSRSSDAGWAATDLDSYMTETAENAPVFIGAFYDGWESLGIKHPTLNVAFINGILTKYNTGYQINGDTLIYGGPHITASPEIPKSFLENSKEIIENSLKEGDKLLSEGRYRPAVQEILWLLETIITVFDGTETAGSKIEGKYFNQIIEKLAKSNSGTTMKQVIEWVRKLHGYLSAPAGGGIRHGLHLTDGDPTTENEARLYYNLVKSYISYFIGEYERLQPTDSHKDILPF